MEFPAVVNFHGIKRFVLTEILQDAVETISHKAWSNRWTRRGISEFEVDLESLGSLCKELLKF